MALNGKDSGDLEWALGIGLTKFQRSTFGEMMARAEHYAYAGETRIVHMAASWAWQPDGSCPMQIGHETTEPSYTPNDEDLTRFASVSRRLRTVEAANPMHSMALYLWYSDVGARWGAQEVGRDAAIYPLTRTGQRYLEVDLVAHPPPLDGDGPRPDERIVNDIHAQKATPNDIRRARHNRMRDEAKDLLRASEAAWVAAAPK